MRFNNVLEHLCGTKSKAKIITELAWSPGRSWTGREIAREAKASQPQAQEALESLEKEGFVEAVRIGGRTHWKFNEKHLLAKPIASIVQARMDVYRRLSEDLAKGIEKYGVVEAYVFGSFASATETQKSDLDLYLEVDTKEKVASAKQWLHKLAVKYVPILGGMLISPIIFSKEEATKKKNLPILREMKKGVRLSDFWSGAYDSALEAENNEDD